MITVKLIGGAKKIFSTEKLEIKKENISLSDLLALIQTMKPHGSPNLDVDNILVAINGIDSSSINGKSTIIKDNDVVSIIPIIHGGSDKLEIKFPQKLCYVFEIKGNKKSNVEFFENLRKKFPHIQLQALSNKFILNPYHMKKILEISIESEKDKILLSNKIETDILLRFAQTTQIDHAIKLVGVNNSHNFILISLGRKSYLQKLEKELQGKTCQIFSVDNSVFLSRIFKITKKHLDSVNSSTPLEDLLIEKASILF